MRSRRATAVDAHTKVFRLARKIVGVEPDREDKVWDPGLDGLVKGIRTAVVDRADDIPGLQDRERVWDEPVDNFDAVAERGFGEDVGEGEACVSTTGSEFPEDLEVRVGDEDGAKACGEGVGVVLVGCDVAAEVDQDCWPLL